MNALPDNSNRLAELERQLTLATAAKLPVGESLDGESAELRQAWQSPQFI